MKEDKTKRKFFEVMRFGGHPGLPTGDSIGRYETRVDAAVKWGECLNADSRHRYEIVEGVTEDSALEIIPAR